jgi:hypothetical protein
MKENYTMTYINRQTYKSYQKLKSWHPRLDGASGLYGNWSRILLVSPDEAARHQACCFFKEILEEKLKRDVSAGEIKRYEVDIVDLKDVPEKGYDLVISFSEFGKRIGNQEGDVFIPIFHNADGHPGLPSFLFDEHKGGILSYSPDGWDKISNHSKRQCYDMVNV